MRQLDWVEGVWPKKMKAAQADPTNDMRRMMYPKVQKYAQLLDKSINVTVCKTFFYVCHTVRTLLTQDIPTCCNI